MKDDLIQAISDLEEETALQIVNQKLKAGETPLEIVEQCRQGVEIVGKKYSEEVYYLSDLIMSEEILRRIMETLEPSFTRKARQNGTKIVMGTIEGDIHDLGKNIIINLLRSHGFDVYDLGVDVEPREFIEAIKETDAKILGISVLLTFSISAVKKVIDLLYETGLRKKVTVLLGGYPTNERIRQFTGADYCETDAIRAVELFKAIALSR
ncbi:methylmalonyl-CoA mutase C-terminal domain-containing protein [Desulfotomaculum arcticum]|uniref:Methylmalonyl-CoA mutase C-terminal domain-containing protein n=1 Tax=Desulfotruncus arcticus DSM 17038 TaxID=1121424 RepID=A0A1I2SVM2_9FIRM|nr:cobalamin-dependent protein [Desulfotruncus arcticus]SFG54186.1 methylmalonyl-CoA mutase C-terminal domain-containing protein [Desulfotomaculum arcticum] [Desulfotruncus arcticus DSM 17038]